MSISVPARVRNRAWMGILAAMLALAALSARGWAPSDKAAADVSRSSPQLALSKMAAPGAIPPGGRVTYTVELLNSGDAPATGVRIVDVLPTGFDYIPGSSKAYENDTLLSTSDPILSEPEVIWQGLHVPAARSGSPYGMHTFVQDRCESDYINYQLDSVRELMGPGAYVTQLFYRIKPQTAGPERCWTDFVNRAYDRDLIPVIRLQGEHGGPYWLKPQPDAPGDYGTVAQAYKRVVAGLPRRDSRQLFIEIWNEPNLSIEWSGAANPVEYAAFLVDVAEAIRSLGDPRIVILNGALSPGGDYGYLAYIDAMATVPGAMQAFDVWASHPYPGNHPPEYNIHDGTATYRDATIDTYLLELERLTAHGRPGMQVLLTETGYALGQSTFLFEGYSPINESNRADYVMRAIRDYWRNWPEVLGVCPFELVDPRGDWQVWDWLYPNGRHHEQYDRVRSLDKTAPAIPGKLRITFQARAGSSSGTFTNQVSATADNATIPPLDNAAPVVVWTPVPTATPSRTLTATSTVTGTPPTATPTPICQSLIANGSFEVDGQWQLSRASFVLTPVQQGERSLRLGLEGEPDARLFSSARQTIRLPDDGSRLWLSYWYFPLSDDLTPNDLQIVRLLDETGDQLESYVRDTSNARQWLSGMHDLTAHAGLTVTLYLAVINDGLGGTTAMYVDDVRLLACKNQVPPPTPTASSTPTQTATPSPTRTADTTATITLTPKPSPSPTPVCGDLVRNPGFEDDGDWQTDASDAYPARYSDAVPHTGQRSLLLGIYDETNAGSFSSAWQIIGLPEGLASAWLSFWYYPISTDLEHDRQYVLILDDQDTFLKGVICCSFAEAQWVYQEHDLTPYAGRRVKLYFRVHNDGQGGSAAMFIDNVSVRICMPPGVPIPPHWSERLQLPLILKAIEMAPQTQEAPGELMPAWHFASARDAAEGPARLALDADRERLYVAWAGGLSILHARSGELVGQARLAGDFHGLALDADRGRVYLADRVRGGIWVWSEENGRIEPFVAGMAQPGGLTLLGERLYAADTARNELWVINVYTGEVEARLPTGRAPYDVEANPVNGQVLVANAGDGTITALSPFDKKVQSVVSLPGLALPLDIAVDPQDGDFYVLYALAPQHHAILAVDGDTLGIKQDWRGDDGRWLVSASQMTVDASEGLLLVSGARGVAVLDTTTFQVTAQLLSQGTGILSGVALDAATGQVYSTDTWGAQIRPLRH